MSVAVLDAAKTLAIFGLSKYPMSTGAHALLSFTHSSSLNIASTSASSMP